jgi:HD-GYP domain-containing protein (c-di-GMP phosphodiesterase class II)
VIRPPPKVIAATALVAVLPGVAVWGLEAAGVLHSVVISVALGAALSLAICQLAARYWKRRADAADMLFGELMIWGWARRCWHERRLGETLAGLERLALTLEARDPYTHGHSRRVARYSSMIAKRMGLGAEEVARIRTAAAVHDVGKLKTPIAVLHKPGSLTDEEFELIKRHPADGAVMVAALGDERLTSIVLHHHERLDGSGYPHGLSGTEIPIGARIIAVADTFDAITSARSYRPARPHEQAVEIIDSEAGTKLDRGAVRAFESVYSGRRPLSAWIALSDLAERGLAWLASAGATTTARVIAIAAGTAALGGGVVAVQAPSGSRAAPGSELGATTVLHPASAAYAGSSGRPLGVSLCCGGALGLGTPSASGSRQAGPAGNLGPAASGHQLAAGQGPASPSGQGSAAGSNSGAASSGGAIQTGSGSASSSGGTAQGHDGGGGSGGAGGSGGSVGPVSTPSPPPVSVGVGSGNGSTNVGASVGRTSAGVAVSSGQSSGSPSVSVSAGSGSTGAQATVGVGTGPSVSVGVSVGGAKLGVSVGR